MRTPFIAGNWKMHKTTEEAVALVQELRAALESIEGCDVNGIIGRTVRGTLAALYGDDVAAGLRIQYGGSVKPANTAEFMVQPEIGGASLRAADFGDCEERTGV